VSRRICQEFIHSKSVLEPRRGNHAHTCLRLCDAPESSIGVPARADAEESIRLASERTHCDCGVGHELARCGKTMSVGPAHSFVAMAVCVVFVGLALWHFRMAASPGKDASAAVPSVSGKPLFVPSVGATIAVGIVLLACACLVAADGGFAEVGLPKPVLTWLCYALALGLLARAVGEFKYVGFFKRVRGSRFANLDTRVYSPLCLLLALGVAYVAAESTTHITAPPSLNAYPIE